MSEHYHSASTGRRAFSVLGLMGAIVLGILGFAVLASFKPEPEQVPPAKSQFNVDVFVAKKACLRQTITGFGTVEADREVTLSAQVAGQILEHDLKVGHAITGEEPILEIDPRIYEQRFEQVENQLAEGESELRRLKQEQANAARLLTKAKSDMETATKQFERRKSLVTKNIATPDELSRALLEFRQYEEALIMKENEAALIPLKIDQIEKRQLTTKTSLELARLDLNYAKVLPPFSGRIGEVFVETGQYVRVGDPLVSITNADSVEVPIPIKLADYAKLVELIHSGETPSVELASDVSAKAQWTGKLTRSAPKADRENRTIEVYVEVDNRKQPTPLLPGTFVHARIAGPLLKDVFAIPRDAIINSHVLIAQPKKEQAVLQKRITIKDTLQNLAILEDQLGEGDQLILTNLDVLYREPAKADSTEGRARTISVNQKHDLPAVLKSQDMPLVQIEDCAKLEEKR